MSLKRGDWLQCANCGEETLNIFRDLLGFYLLGLRRVCADSRPAVPQAEAGMTWHRYVLIVITVLFVLVWTFNIFMILLLWVLTGKWYF